MSNSPLAQDPSIDTSPTGAGRDRRPTATTAAVARDFAAIYEALPAAAFLIDVDSGRVVHGNQAALQLSGHNRTQLVGRKAARMFPRSELGKFWEHAGSSDDQQPGEFIGWLQTREGNEVAISALARLLPSADSPLCVLLAFDITELKLGIDRLGERDRQDAVTGMVAREVFEAELAQYLQGRPGAGTVALVAVALDELERIGDAYGPALGDDLMAAFAQRLQATWPGAAILARGRGDRLLAVFDALPTSLLDARRRLTVLAEEALAVAREPYVLAGATVTSSCSIGIAITPHDTGDADQLERCATLALQQSRRVRRDGFRFFIDSDSRHLDEDIRIEAILREEIACEGMEQVWQPIFRLADECCIGVESLLRGGDALRGFATSRIVAVAETCGLLTEIGHLGLRRSLQGWSRLLADGRDPAIGQFCLNVTSQELLEGGFVDELLRASAAARLPNGRIVLDIAERDLFSSLDRVRPLLERLANQGIRLGIDGFGTGLSSLVLLRDLPISLIKIDRSFIWQLEASQRDREIVRAMILLAHSLDVKAAAVGVETRAQLQALRGMGCDYAQGYLLSHPLRLEELSQFLRPHAAKQR